MGRFNDITLEELHEVCEQADGGKPRECVLAAIGRKQGDHLDTFTEHPGVVEKTIRNWLDRFAEEPIEQAPYDGPRSAVPQNSNPMSASNCSNNRKSRQLNSVTTSKYGRQNFCSTTSKRSTVSNTAKATHPRS
ncbi:hypothetical protein [Halocatena marina]|uniref:hypothetical protein n=1 Tax=Halocatena marina TaxID=2934937 RepID=UPI00200D8B91|nr:hypothetical protein [Halocatena marina]